MKRLSIFWFRRDLRLHDNKALFYALSGSSDVLPLFIFDTEILDKLPADDARVDYIHKSLEIIQNFLAKTGRSLWVYKGKPLEIIKKLTSVYTIEKVWSNKDHEPYGIKRDEEVKKYLRSKGIDFETHLDHLFFEKDEVLKNDGTPYHVFTPYSRKCRELFTDEHLRHYPSENLLNSFTLESPPPFPSLQQLGFKPSGLNFPPKDIDQRVIAGYDKTRNFPGENGTTRLGLHLRFGTVGLRELTRSGRDINDTYFNELIWREFYAMILWHYPHVTTQAFKPQYDRIPWRNNPDEFEKWKEGKTGYPIVDAGMRELSQTGYMHNRVRMIAASFLTKHLLIDWRWGEAWFALKLLDFELSSNNGGWQWSAGSGCDAAPYFRIFNPIEQQKKFDARGKYVTTWVPEYSSMDYPQPIVEHKFARERCLTVFKDALSDY